MSDFIEISSEMSFLIVDDMPSFREVLSHTLRKLGFKTIFQAVDGTSALTTLKREKIGFVICERNLRMISGMELLKEIRETPEFLRVPFMMMAAEIPKEDVILASEYGVDGYLKKPFVINDVSSRLSASMARYMDPTNPEGNFEDARIQFMEGNYLDALRLYAEIKEHLPTSARVLTGMARCYRALNQSEKAEEHLREAIKANPLYVHAHHDLGLVYLQRQKTELALECFSRAIDISPGNPVRYEAVGDILMQSSRYKEAEDYLMKAVKLELAYPTLYAQLGKALFAQKKNEKAAQFFEKALHEQPENTSFLNSMGICMKELGRLDEAITYYNQALKLRPADVKILFNKALCLVSMKQFERAKKLCLQILKVDPGYTKAQNKIKEIEQLEEKAKLEPKEKPKSSRVA